MRYCSSIGSKVSVLKHNSRKNESCDSPTWGRGLFVQSLISDEIMHIVFLIAVAKVNEFISINIMCTTHVIIISFPFYLNKFQFLQIISTNALRFSKTWILSFSPSSYHTNLNLRKSSILINDNLSKYTCNLNRINASFKKCFVESISQLILLSRV